MDAHAHLHRPHTAPIDLAPTDHRGPPSRAVPLRLPAVSMHSLHHHPPLAAAPPSPSLDPGWTHARTRPRPRARGESSPAGTPGASSSHDLDRQNPFDRLGASSYTSWAESASADSSIEPARIRKDSYASTRTEAPRRRKTSRGPSLDADTPPPPPVPHLRSHHPPDQANFLETAPSPAPAAAAAPTSTSSASSSSKSVLTVALQRAQSAVLLDSANNYPSAIAAYAQAVRLLKEVMHRIEEGASAGGGGGADEGRGRRREGESEQEAERRRAKLARKDKARADEARRLRVIHDTYEDRIRMLVQMGTPLPPPSPTVPAAAWDPDPAPPVPEKDGASLHAEPGGRATTTTINDRNPASPVRSQDVLAPVPTSSHPYAYALSAGSAAAARDGPAPSPRTAAYAALRDGDGEGIGAAMLQLASPPRDDEADPAIGALDTATRHGEPVLARLPVVQGSGADWAGGEAGEAELRGLAPAAAAVGREGGRPLSVSSDATARVPAGVGAGAAAGSWTAGTHGLGLLEGTPKPGRGRAGVGEAGEEQIFQPLQAGPEAELEPEPELAPYPREPVTAPVMRRGFSAGSLPFSGPGQCARTDSDCWTATAATAAAPVMQRGYSTDAVTGGSSASAYSYARREEMLIGALAFIEEGGAPIEARPRPARGASLFGVNGSGATGAAGGPAMVPAAGQPSSSSLVNPTTSGGTISQRRLAAGSPPLPAAHPSPFPSAAEGPPQTSTSLAPNAGPLDLEAHIIVRAPSTETERGPSPQPAAVDDFGRPAQPPAAAQQQHYEAWATGSLPARFPSTHPSRQRPRVPFETGSVGGRPLVTPLEIPPVPLSAASSATVASPSDWAPRTSSYQHHHPSASASSLSTSAGPSRKGSMPTPTSLGTPSLGRSPSASSAGSTASSSMALRRRRSLARPSFSGHGHSSSLSGGVYLSAGLADPPDASSPASRESTLAVPPPRRPFHLMRLVLATMPSPSSNGGYISEKLFVPAQVWTTQGGTKLVALETKVRMLDLLSTGLDALDRAGRGLLLVPTASASARAVVRQEAERFGRELDSFEGLAEGIQSTLAKKLGAGVVLGAGSGSAATGGSDRDPKYGRKGSTASFASWSSKLSQSLNRVTNGASLDSQATYVDALAKVLKQAQSLDEHLALLLSGPTPAFEDSPYSLLERPTRQQLERSLRRCSDFFGQVICRLVLQDVGVLLDKYVKRGGAWLSAD